MNLGISHIENRKKLVGFLRSELMGPCLYGEELDCSGEIYFETWKDADKPWIQKENHDEIINRETPVNRYGIGVLFPIRLKHEENPDSDIEVGGPITEVEAERYGVTPPEIKTLGRPEEESGDADDFDLSLANTLQPSSMGISFLAELPNNAYLTVSVTAGKYLPKDVRIQNSNRKWFLRQGIEIPDIRFSGDCLKSTQLPEPFKQRFENGMVLSAECYSRPDIYSGFEHRENRRLITVCIVNRTEKKANSVSAKSELSFFQSKFSIQVPGGKILPYPEAQKDFSIDNQFLTDEDRERASFRLLYNTKQTYAIGHGCAATWDDSSSIAPETISADPLPEYELPSITPDAKKSDGSDLKIFMPVLAGIRTGSKALLGEFLSEYQSWISQKENEIYQLDTQLQPAARMHIENAALCLTRMRQGLEFIATDPIAAKAFQLANQAILMQQIVKKEKRLFDFDAKKRRNIFNPPYEDIDMQSHENNAFWRAFQVAFILMSLRSSVINCEDRENVELIWFPTGGGKTEAYLGLAAFAMFYRRLKDPKDDGVHVLMRYTLRLLTTQQFQRACRLICAMEKIRKDNADMGETPFSVGIWVGSSNTPNSGQRAHTALNKMRNQRNAENPFLLRQCPWCGAEMGTKTLGRQIHILGYSSTGNSVVFNCPERHCPFHSSLPIHVIDEEIYKHRPSLIIGTVDKFAMLAWVPESGALFGLNRNGVREKKPPGLIIQDELHLISGPLGTMVGLYETVIEELCSEKNDETILKPKIVCSTATIRRYQDQIKALFARKNVFLFPPPGLDAGDSFFSRYALDETGKPLPGRRYLGVYAPGLSSLQTLQVRVFATLLMGVMSFEQNEERDPWWTLMIFFNSLRELGGALSLFQTDIPGMVKAVAARNGLPSWRRLDYILELTSRMNNEEVPFALEELEKKYRGNRSRAIDVCLASSIIEVGIDVDRLSLMSIVGQPKTVSQYIQVSGRIGRKWQERPGLVLTLYSSTKPRDRSFFEKFQSVHSQLFAQVEPTSVTPFSPPAIDRALHALFAIYLRLFGDAQAGESPQNVNPELLNYLKTIIKDRTEFIDSSEINYVLNRFDKKLRQFNRWQRVWWFKQQEPGDSLLRRYETWVTEKIERTSWATPTSMRNVDAECQMDITTLYNQQKEDN
jgi:hypothetical protein